MRLLTDDERADQAVTVPVLRMQSDLNCGSEGHCAKTGVDPDKVVWACGLKFCPNCPCNPSNLSSHARAPEHLLA